MLTFKFPYEGLILDVKAHYDEPDVEDWYISEGWVIDSVHHKGVEMCIEDMNADDELSTAASVASLEQYEPDEEQ